MSGDAQYDLAVIGGGINGVGIARDAAGRGLRTVLLEQNDLGWATSSRSTHLIHGGLRYLEYYEFRLVAEALAERETVLALAPHIVWPMTFILPHEKHLRPAWMIRAGLLLYDNLGRGFFALTGGRSHFAKSRAVTLTPDGYGAGLKPEFRRGFAYADAWVDDARLVIANARSAADKGAVVRTRARVVDARRAQDAWTLVVRDATTGRTDEVTARAVVNAGGPWVKALLDGALHVATPTRVRLVKGSHIVVPRIHAGSHALLLQNPDMRVIFMLPYEHDFTMIGTTEVPVDDPEVVPEITREEIEYLCQASSRYALRPITPREVRHTFAGVRPLFDDGRGDVSSVTRDYRFELDERGAPLLSVFGGKITTYRRLGEKALERLARFLPPMAAPWTDKEPLPGGDFGGATFAELAAGYRRRYPGLDPVWLERLLRRHGTDAAEILGDAKTEADLGERFGGGLYERELRFLVEREWARTAEDVLERRTKCGLAMTEAQRRRVAEVLGG
ncbi:MAG: glycerol-3-phosphate dehydrogenase [Burkholderiales bacterium]|nr:glycerol-3-phosphate dehydrogenase [Burkholderiales bacterium]